MRKLLLSISLTLIAATSFGQYGWYIDFDPPNYDFINRIVRDTISNPNCSWEIGSPTKAAFTSAYSIPNAIITDKINPVVPNDTSIFYLKHFRDNNLFTQPYHNFQLQFMYQLNGDSTDKGIIEISPDTGNTWINILTQDSVFEFIWQQFPIPTLTGSTNGWQQFGLDMTNWASGWGNYPIAMTADTILFRFTYITDSSSVLHDGWIIDDFQIADIWESIDEVQNNNLISIYPNPSSDKLVVNQRSQPTDKTAIQIINYSGQVLYSDQHFTGAPIDTRLLPNGIYLLKYSDSNSYAIKKFIVQH